MKEFKGTPGPWHYCADEPDWVTDSNDNIAVARVTRCNADAEAQHANAKLIAAAPELLEALHGMIQAHKSMLFAGYERIIELGGSCDSPEAMISSNPDIRKAQAAINKALGE